MGEDDNFWPAGAPSQGPRRRLRPVQRDLLPSADGGKRSRSGTWSSRSSTASAIRRTTCARCPARTSTPAWAWSGWPRCCRASIRTTTSTSSARSSKPPAKSAASSTIPPSDNGRRLRRIADHVRACTFAIHENVLPGPNKQNYVIRRLLRRAVLDGYQMGLREPFLFKLVADRRRADEASVSRAAATRSSACRRSSRPKRATFFGTIDAGLDRIEQDVRRDADGRPRRSCRARTRPSCTRPTASRPNWSRAWPPS